MLDSIETVRMWLTHPILGIPLSKYILSLVILTLTFFVRKALELYVIKKILALLSKTSNHFDNKIIEALSKPLNAFILVWGFYLSVAVLISDITLPWNFHERCHKAFKGASGLIIVWAVYRLIDILVEYLDEATKTKKYRIDRQFIPLIRTSSRVFVLMIGTLTVLRTLDFDEELSTILATLGLGGLSIAIAAQDTIANFFGSIVLFTDRPFKVGDWIKIGDKVDGDVEAIGFRSTKVRTWPKTVLTIPNKVLSNEIIDNWSRMPKRRVRHNIQITYDTTPEQMEKLLDDLRQILKEDEGINQDFFLVKFLEFGASSLDIMLYYFTTSTSWKPHLETRERINLKVLRCVSDNGLTFAFPTRTVHIEN